MEDPFGIARGSGGKIKDHRVLRLRGHTDQVLSRHPHGFRNVFKTFRLRLHAPELCGHLRFLQCLPDLPGHLILRGTDNGAGPGRLHPVYQITDCQHMRDRDHHRAQLMQGHCRKPVFIVALQDQHHPVPAADSRRLKHIRHLIAELPDIREGKDMLLSLRVAPYQRPFLRFLLCCPVHHVIAEVEIIRIIQPEFLQCPVFVRTFTAKVLIDTHTDSFITASAPILRNLSYRFPMRSASFVSVSISSLRRFRIRS